jgi:RNA polymerase sigma factor (sigma-70 family)
MSDVTRILSQIESGDSHAAEQLLPLIYDELRKLAAAKLAHENPGQTLQATALVHEAYLRLVGGGARDSGLGAEDRVSKGLPLVPNPEPQAPSFHSRAHFFNAAAQAMRRILIERARGRAALKRGGQRQQIDLESLELAEPERAEELLALDAALQKLQAVEPQAAELVQLRYFAGCTMEEAAELLGTSLRSTNRLWAYAKAWLLEELDRD